MTQTSKDPETYFFAGSTPFFASRHDQRLSYCLHVPRERQELAASEPMPLVVIQHGTARTAMAYRDHYREFADLNGCVILAPLFPAGIVEADDLHGFKFIDYHGIRFDEELLAIIDEVGERYHVQTDRFYLHGFSGGGQFAHRFFFLHPERLAAVSIGAPGRVTLLDNGSKWWLGTADFRQRFGTDIDLQAMREVPVQMVVGACDVETWEINNVGGSNWMDGVERTGSTRIERIETLRRNFVEHGIRVRLDIVPGVAHEGIDVIPAVQSFLGAILNGQPWQDSAVTP